MFKLLDIIHYCSSNTVRLYLNLFSDFAVILEHVSWSSLGHVEDALEGHFSLSSEVDLGHGVSVVLQET